MDYKIERIEVSAYKIPTDQPEADGTMRWDSTTLVLVEAEAGGEKSLGFNYADAVRRASSRTSSSRWCGTGTPWP